MAPKNGHAIGSTTIGAAGAGGVGGGLGAALADVLVELVPRLEPVEGSVGIILAAVLAAVLGILGGKFAPSSEKHETPREQDLPPSPSPDFVVVDPADEGHGGPEDEDLEPAGELDHVEPGAGSPVLPVPAEVNEPLEEADERSGSTRA